MRGRKPHLIVLSEKDRTQFQKIVRDGRTEQRVARRARILLAMENEQTIVQDLADKLDLTPRAIRYVCDRYQERGIIAIYDAPRTGRPPIFSSLTRVEIEQLACCEPAGIGMEITHWSTRTLAQIAAQRGIVPKIAYSTVSLILRNADLQPHRSRYWKTPILNAEFRERASKILWCYEQVCRLIKESEILICIDEKPNLQALERLCPTQPMRSGQIERREFEYIRHGTVNFVAALLVHSGEMRGWCLDNNDGEHLRPVLAELYDEFDSMQRIHLIWDGGSSHISRDTQLFQKSYSNVRVLLTPAHASWLNQAELLLRAFTCRYLDRGDWKSRQDLIDHLDASWREYNHMFAHPISWSWTRYDLRRWMNRVVS